LVGKDRENPTKHKSHGSCFVVRSTVMTRGLAVLALVALASGCFGYNKSAKRWSYAGNTVLILGGGATIGVDFLTKSDPAPAMPGVEDKYERPFSGALVAGSMLVAAGLLGMILTATRPNVKSTH